MPARAASEPTATDRDQHACPERRRRALPDELVVVVLSGSQRGRQVRLGERLRIGKAPDNDLVLPDDTVSRHHCELERARARHPRARSRLDQPHARRAHGDSRSGGRSGRDHHGRRRRARRAQSSRDRAQLLPSESTQFGDALGQSLAHAHDLRRARAHRADRRRRAPARRRDRHRQGRARALDPPAEPAPRRSRSSSSTAARSATT